MTISEEVSKKGFIKHIGGIEFKNISENKTVKLLNINWATGREDFLEHSYNMAIETLNGGDNCCLEGKVSLVEDSD